MGVPPVEATVNVTVIPWPTAEGFGLWPVIVVVVPAAVTVWAAPAEVLPVKLASPAYVAVSVLAPAVVEASAQLPAATVPTQFTVPSLTVSVPVGVPLPGTLTATV